MANDKAGGSGTAPTTWATGDLKFLIKDSIHELFHKYPMLLDSGDCHWDQQAEGNLPWRGLVGINMVVMSHLSILGAGLGEMAPSDRLQLALADGERPAGKDRPGGEVTNKWSLEQKQSSALPPHARAGQTVKPRARLASLSF